MRPIPKPRHLPAVCILALVAATYAYMAWHDQRLSSEQVHIATSALKRYQRSLFEHDPVYTDDGPWRTSAPTFQMLMDLSLTPTGYQDLTLGFRMMTGVVVMIYLCGMYALLYRQTRSWAMSTFVAVLSTAVTHGLGDSSWGLGPLATIQPRGLCIAFMPLFGLALLRYGNPWRMIVIFFLAGLMGNLDMVMSMNLTIVLIVAYLGLQRFRPRAWLTALAGAGCAFVAALPYWLYCYALRRSMSGGASEPAGKAFLEAMRIGGWEVLYPDMFDELVNWLVVVAVLAGPIAVMLFRVERYRVRHVKVWLWFIVAVLLVTFGLHGASQLYGAQRAQTPPILGFLSASSLVMLPLYVLFAQSMTILFRIIRGHRSLLRWACAALMVAWLLPANNLRVARHAVLHAGSSLLAEQYRPRSEQRHQERLARQAELESIAEWASGNTPENAVFITDQIQLRMLASRAIVASRFDVDYFYYYAPAELEWWNQTIHAQRRFLRAAEGKNSERMFAQLKVLLGQNNQLRLAGSDHLYAIILAGITAAGSQPPAYLTPIEQSGWGRHYRLYRVNQAILPGDTQPQTAPSTQASPDETPDILVN